MTQKRYGQQISQSDITYYFLTIAIRVHKTFACRLLRAHTLGCLSIEVTQSQSTHKALRQSKMWNGCLCSHIKHGPSLKRLTYDMEMWYLKMKASDEMYSFQNTIYNSQISRFSCIAKSYQSKRRQTETSTTKTSTNRDVDKPKRRQP